MKYPIFIITFLLTFVSFVVVAAESSCSSFLDPFSSSTKSSTTSTTISVYESQLHQILHNFLFSKMVAPFVQKWETEIPSENTLRISVEVNPKQMMMMTLMMNKNEPPMTSAAAAQTLQSSKTNGGVTTPTKNIVIEIQNARMKNGEFSASKVVAINNDKKNQDDDDETEKIIKSMETQVRRAVEIFGKYESLFKGVDIYFSFEKTAIFSLFLSVDENTAKAPWFVWSYLKQVILLEKAEENNSNNNKEQKVDDTISIINSIDDIYEKVRQKFIYNRLFAEKSAEKSASPLPKLSPFVLESLSETMHDFFLKPSIPWFSRTVVTWFNLFCDIANCKNYISGHQVMGSPFFNDFLLVDNSNVLPCSKEIFEFVSKKLNSNRMIPILFYLVRRNNNVNEPFPEEIQKYFDFVTRCFRNNKNNDVAETTDTEMMNKILDFINNVVETPNSLPSNVKQLLSNNNNNNLAKLILDYFPQTKIAFPEMVRFVSGVLFGYRFIDHVVFAGSSGSVSQDIKRALFLPPIRHVDFGLHPNIFRDLLGISDDNNNNNDGKKKNKQEVQFYNISQDWSKCLSSDTHSACQVLFTGMISPQIIHEYNKVKNNKSEHLTAVVTSLKLQDKKQHASKKYSPLSLGGESSFFFSDSSYQITLDFPIEQRQEFDCKLLHKKCWSCVVAKDGETVSITQGISVREFDPHPLNNQCVDCERAAAAVDEEDGDGNLLDRGVSYRCTLQCVWKVNGDL